MACANWYVAPTRRVLKCRLRSPRVSAIMGELVLTMLYSWPDVPLLHCRYVTIILSPRIVPGPCCALGSEKHGSSEQREGRDNHEVDYVEKQKRHISSNARASKNA